MEGGTATARPPAGEDAPDRRDRRALLFPVGLIVVSLIALVVVPLVLQRETGRIEAHRDDVIQPARDLVNTVQLSLAREMGALRGFVITGNEDFLERYEEALGEEREAREALAPLIAELGPEVSTAFHDLRLRASRWHGRVTEAEILTRQLVPEEFIERIPSEELRYEETLEAVEILRARLVAEVEANRHQIQQLEGTSLILTIMLALLAAAAALGALWLGRRLRLLATEAETRRAEVEHVAQNRSRLIRGITHDLKNPLGGARGHLQLVRSGVVEDPDRRQESLERAERAIDTALEIISDLLGLSKAEAGDLSLAREPTNIPAVVGEAVEDQKAESEKRGLTLEVDPLRDPPRIETDPRRVREIVRNLVSNAVKYTPEGGSVTVRIQARGRHRGREKKRRWVTVDVHDTGPGIAPGDQERIFEEFTRLEGGEAKVEGTGLGLAISRHVARLLGGDIDVESEVGRGSTFTLWLPVRPPSRQRPPRRWRPGPDGTGSGPPSR